MRIEGEIEFAEIFAPFAGVTIIVKVEDTRRADAPAMVSTEHRIRNVSRSPDHRDPVPFAIDCPDGGELTHCALRVHVDVDADGDVSPEDYVSSQSYPLAGAASLTRLLVRVQPVR